MTEIEKQWEELTQRYVSKLNKYDGDWTQLNEEEQELSALWKLEADVYNGGFIQFFCNWGFDCYNFAIRCLGKIDAKEIYKIVTQQHAIIQRLEDDENLQELWDIPKLLTELEIIELDKLDKKYWGNEDNLLEKTLKTYNHL